MTHTPTPYVTHELGGTIYIGRGKQDVNITHIVATVDCQEAYIEESKQARRRNAAHIVKCVNLHDELVGALTNLLNGVQTGAIRSDHDETLANAMLRGLNALRKARGEA